MSSALLNARREINNSVNRHESTMGLVCMEFKSLLFSFEYYKGSIDIYACKSPKNVNFYEKETIRNMGQ
jgi:hypothetical protein